MTAYTFTGNFLKFDAKAAIYNAENALALIDCARLAYRQEDEIKTVISANLKFKNFKFFSGFSTQGFVAGNNKIIVVAFRGTEKTVADILADANLILTKGPIGKVHSGFYSALHEIWGAGAGDQNMLAYLKQIRDQDQIVWFCGHSLGGAIAVLAAAEYVFREKQDMGGIYTAGQPKVGDAEFAKLFNEKLKSKCFRFVNNSDIVARVPFATKKFNYVHVGKMIYIDQGGKFRESLPWWKKILEYFQSVSDAIKQKKTDLISDHGSAGYVSFFAKNMTFKFKA